MYRSQQLLALLWTLLTLTEGMQDMGGGGGGGNQPDPDTTVYFTTMINDPVPYIRFFLWNALTMDPTVPAITPQQLAEALGYNQTTWETPGSAGIEKIAYEDLGPFLQVQANALGFTEDNWDCYVNHFND